MNMAEVTMKSISDKEPNHNYNAPSPSQVPVKNKDKKPTPIIDKVETIQKKDENFQSPTASLKALEHRLNLIQSPPESKVLSSQGSSIPTAHNEYEKMLRYLEAESRAHIKTEQQMKL